MAMNIRPFTRVLRPLGFKLDYDSRAGGMRTVQFSRKSGPRLLEVQLWDGGHHRATHFLDGRMSTMPTPFQTAEELPAVIERELTRTDHPPK